MMLFEDKKVTLNLLVTKHYWEFKGIKKILQWIDPLKDIHITSAVML